jgi:hypothetical protein
MPSQKLQVSRAIKVVPSDTINIPNPANKKYSGVNSSAAANKLIDSTASFTEANIGDIVYNQSLDTIAKVTALDSATQLTLSADIFTLSSQTYSIYADTNESCVLHTAVAGDVSIITAGNDEVTLSSQNSQYHPVFVKRVKATGTTATGIIAFW